MPVQRGIEREGQGKSRRKHIQQKASARENTFCTTVAPSRAKLCAPKRRPVGSASQRSRSHVPAAVRRADRNSGRARCFPEGRRTFLQYNPVNKDVAIVYSPLNGTGLKPVTRTLKEMGYTNITVVKEQEQPDGNFPT